MNKYFSRARLAKVSEQDYIDNIRVSMNMYPLLHVFEIALRNRMSEFISHEFGDNFIKNFLLDKNSLKLTKTQENKVYEVYNRIYNKQIKRNSENKYPKIEPFEEYIVCEDDLIGNISLGFWIICLKESFTSKNSLDVENMLKKIFNIKHNIINVKKREKKYNDVFKKVGEAMDLIHNARNRIYHYETILNHKSYHHTKIKETLVKYILLLECKKNDLFNIINPVYSSIKPYKIKYNFYTTSGMLNHINIGNQNIEIDFIEKSIIMFHLYTISCV